MDKVTGGSTVVPTGCGAKVMVDDDNAAAAVAATALVAVPVSDTTCVPGVAESLSVSVAVRVPVALGVKMTLIAQLAPAARVLGSVPQVFVWPKSMAFAPPSAIPLTVNAALPVLDSVTDCAALAVPVAWLANVSVDADKLATGTAAAVLPVPVSVTVCVLGDAVSLIVSVAERVPIALGVNVTLIVQLPPAARILGRSPQVFVCPKFVGLVPPRVKLLIVIAAFPVLDNVTGLAALVVPVDRLANVSVVTDRLAFGATVVLVLPALSLGVWQPEFPQSFPALWLVLSRTQSPETPYQLRPRSWQLMQVMPATGACFMPVPEKVTKLDVE